MKILLIIVFLLVCLFACLLLGNGIAKQRRIRDCKREAETQWECPTSNAAEIFIMQIRTFQHNHRKTDLWGNGQGPLPEKGEVLYLVTGEKRYPVWICKVAEEDMPETMSGVKIRVTVLGADKVEFTQDTRLTNERDPKLEKALCQAADDTEDPNGKIDGVVFPIKIKNSAGETWYYFLLMLIGAVEVAFCILEIACFGNAGAGIGLPIFLALAGLVLAGVSFWQFWKRLVYLVKITEDDLVSIHRPGHTISCHIDNLYFENDWSRELKDTQVMKIFNHGGHQLAEISSRSGGYEAALLVFSEAAKLRRKKTLYQYLTGTSFYIPAETFNGKNDGEQHTFPSIMENQSTGVSSIFLFDNEDVLKEDMVGGEFNSILQIRLDHALNFLVDYQVLQLVLFLTDPMLPETYTITRENRDDIQKFIDSREK